MNIKKMLLLAMAVGALVAFAIPSVAGAAQLTNGKGGLTEGTITATSTNTVTTIPLGTLTCKNVVIHGNIEENAGGSVRVAMDGSSDTATGCLLNGALEVAITPTFEGLSGTGAGPGTAAFSFNAGICEAEATAGVVTWNGTDVIHITSPTTGSCGAGTLTGDFTLSNAAGEVIAET